MKQKPSTIFIASALAGLFTIFNVGLPFVLYVCPMMAGGRCTCTCSQPTSEGPALTYVHTGCCNNQVVAERNTTPFLGTDKYQSHHFAVEFVLTAKSHSPWQTIQSVRFLAFSDSGPPPSDTPLYLLSSSLLI